ncbi:MAG: hypothetical protein R2704_12360 [Microthrixaceae bacterium]
MAKPSATTNKPSATSTAAGLSSGGSDSEEAHWSDQVADLIVDAVDRVRDRTVTPAQSIAKYVVYGAVIAVLALPLLVVTLVALVRVMDAFIPSGVWVPYLILGVAFVVVGILLWSKRTK